MSIPNLVKPFHIVQLNPGPAVRNEWIDWYERVHIPRVLEVELGIVSAARFERVWGVGEWSDCVRYDFISEAALTAFIESPKLTPLAASYSEAWGEVTTRLATAYRPVSAFQKQR